MTDLEKSLVKITSLLSEGNIPYMLIGGYAMAIHGYPRLTQDLDISLGVDIDKCHSILQIVNDKFNVLLEDPLEFAEKTNVLLLQDKETGIRLDLIFSFIEFERNAIAHAESVQLNGNTIQNVTIEDLIVYKMLAGRERDKEDVMMILAGAIGKLNINNVTEKIQSLSDILQNDSYTNWLEILNSLTT